MEELRELLERKDGTSHMVCECVELVKRSEKVVIFGAGIGGRDLYNLLEREGISDKVIAFSDNNKLKFYNTYMNADLSIIPPDNLINEFGVQGTILIIASSAYDVIKKQLIAYGFPEENIFLFNFAFMDLEYTDKEFIWDHIEDFERAYDRMADEKSRKIFTDILNYKITKDDNFLYHLQENVDDERLQYFPLGIFAYCEDERFVDIGAYIGDTLDVFNAVYHGKWEAYYAFEADAVVYSELEQAIAGKSYRDKIEAYNLAAWNEKTTLYFEENIGSSSMKGRKNNGALTEVVAGKLDDVLEGEKVTFIKMDIEGAEKNAICGMRKLLQKNKPIVAMCVYHRRDDFFVLTDLLDEILPGEYIFYFRQYRFTPTETVCYAIPKNRLV